jgi:hypothetical protein
MKNILSQNKGEPVQKVKVPVDISESGYSISSDHDLREGYVYDKQYKNPMKTSRGYSKNYYHILIPLDEDQKDEISERHKHNIGSHSFYRLKGVYINKIKDFNKKKFDQEFEEKVLEEN